MQLGSDDLVCLLLTGIQVSQFHLELCCSLFVSSNEVRVVPPHTLQHPLLNHLGLLQATFVLSHVSPTLQYTDNMLHVQDAIFWIMLLVNCLFSMHLAIRCCWQHCKCQKPWHWVSLPVLVNSLR